MSHQPAEQPPASPNPEPAPQAPPAQPGAAQQPDTWASQPGAQQLPGQNTRNSGRDLPFDLVTGLLLTGFCGLTAAYDPGRIALSFALTLPWIIRRRYPLVTLAITTAAALGQALALDTPLFAIITVPLLVYSFARWSARGLARASILIALAGSIIGPARWFTFSGSANAADLGFQLVIELITALACAGMVSVAYVIGSRRREKVERQTQSIQEAMERQRLMLAEQEQRTRAAAVDERNRIARELHDIVAHSLSVIVVQAEGGRALATKKPEKGPEVLSTVADTSREALEEMRRMVGLLRQGSTPGVAGGDGNDSYQPTPGLADLPDLVAKTGNQVRIQRNGPQPQVSQALGLTAYRIVQESLTNFLKYAGSDAHADVVVDYYADGIQLQITDDGAGGTENSPSRPDSGTGHGLQGMTERVAMHHGILSAQPRPTGGFEVRAWLPLPSITEQTQNRR